MLRVEPVGEFAVAHRFHVERFAGQIHESDVSGSVLRLNVGFNALGLSFHHAHKLVTSFFNFRFIAAFE